jgi:hypothetical protein
MAWLRRARGEVEWGHDVVLGPARDGGYYLLAYRPPCPALFVDVPWGTSEVLATTVARCGAARLSRAMLPELFDVDVAADLDALPSGSDLASVRTRGDRTPRGWRINGQKLWTTNAHNAHFMIALVRTGEGSQRQDGLTQFLIDLNAPGVSVRPIFDLVGARDFNEVFLEDVLVPDDMRVGEEGAGWKQVTAELSLERSGPERYLSSYALLVEFIRISGPAPTQAAAALIGQLTTELWTLRHMSRSTAAKLAGGDDPALEAAIVKDLGNGFEQALPRLIQAVSDVDLSASTEFARALALLLQVSPSFSLRGGTREILRGIIARGLGLR